MAQPLKIIEMQFGSHVYGTNLPTSDLDLKAVGLPPRRDIILQKSFRTIQQSTGDDKSKNTPEDIDFEMFSLHYFMKLLTEGQTVCLDMLFTPEKHWRETGLIDIWHTLLENKYRLISKKMSAFAGYCQTQAAKYSFKGSNLSAYKAAHEFFSLHHPHEKIKDINLEPLLSQFPTEKIKALNGKDSPLMQVIQIDKEVLLQVGPKTKVPFNASAKTATEIFKRQYDQYGERAKLAAQNSGIDWKALMHAVRVCQEAIELVSTGHITFPRPERELLLEIRKGNKPYAEIADLIEEGLYELNEKKEKSNLPTTPDLTWIDDFTAEIYDYHTK